MKTEWKEHAIMAAFSIVWICSIAFSIVCTFGLAWLGVQALISVFG